jgi:protein O-GlcNAc transferase
MAMAIPDADRIYREALAAFQQGRMEEGIALVRNGIAGHPDEARFHKLLGAGLGQLGRNEEALATLDRAAALAPTADIFGNRADILATLGRTAEALQSYDRAVTLDPNSVDDWCNRGALLQDLGRYDDALASVERAIAIAPSHAPAHYNRGNALMALRRHEAALASFDRSLALEPSYVDALNNRGECLRALGHTEQVIESFDRALSLAPNNRAALYNRAISLSELQRFSDALACIERLLKIAPDNANALYIRGKCLEQLQRLNEAIDSYDRAAQLGHGLAAAACAYCCLAVCAWPAADQAAERLQRFIDDERVVLAPTALLPLAIDPARQLKCVQRFAKREWESQAPVRRSNLLSTNGRIRLAYLSADFGSHAVTELVTGLFERHDRTRFEIIGVSVGPGRSDDTRDRVANACDSYLELGAAADAEIAERLAALEVHIAVDLTGYTEGGRPGVLARRPAPVQVSYLGYLGSMGAPFIDYVLADALVLPFDQQRFYAERIVHLPGCFLVNDNRLAISPTMPSRQEVGLPRDGFVFCSFNNSYKFRAPMFDMWMRLLRDIDGSVLWLLAANPAVVTNLRREAEARRVDPARLVFAPRADFPDHLARQRLADLFLDTLPYNAGATVAAALWAGVPVLTAVGDSFVGRMAGSMLHGIDLPELATAGLDEYEAMARKLAADATLLAEKKATLQRNRRTHPLFDTDRSRRHIEAAFDMMWHIHQRGEPPRAFAVAQIVD